LVNSLVALVKVKLQKIWLKSTYNQVIFIKVNSYKQIAHILV